jgi:hypothetical protein
MCIFTTTVRHVSSTRILARIEGGAQLLAYQMLFESLGDTAMVLPLPVATGAGEQALRFIDLEAFPQLFDYLDLLFPEADAVVCSRPASATLAVHDVGAFEASFVPTAADFARLDPRFRLPDSVWGALPGYADFGFAVFKLRTPRSLLGRLGLKKPAPGKAHPMAFSFQSRHQDRLFFPTVHVHDGAVHATAAFDHQLYCQPGAKDAGGELGWRASQLDPGTQVSFAGAQGLVLDGARVLRARLEGELPNQDIYVPLT